ncbi:MAG: DUF3604 domain-containing protein [Phenylobacterium sp.]|uniref:DUF3604 domain-containing protein n=1 Tax=Phenylobacterium sp. TaxID=1871053 RepID=UPI0025D3C3A3|nr:DUF3604 domain-containing protein [Phenylobacterium sp.]MBI1198035.1 DUF3604 domain-containing protein [Phenylobacterium sp.]
MTGSRPRGAMAASTALALLIGAGVAYGATRVAGSEPAPAAKAAGTAAKPAAASAAATPQHLPGYNPDRNAYFGDLHVHTYLSNDAYIFNVRRTPDDAYRFAKGEPIGHAAGYQIRLAGGPLDFVAVTDHSEYMGAIREAGDPNTPLSKLPFSQGLFSPDPAKIMEAFRAFVRGRQDGTLPKEFQNPAIISRAWSEVQQAAARNYQPGKFTTLVGYEFTSAPDGRNLHRNVIFRGANVPGAPYSATASADPENLWRAMDAWRGRGIEALAIPHNSNGSDGLMFDTTRMNGEPIDRAYAELRARNEPLVELTQIKGTSETHPSLSPNDEWANFEIMETYIGHAKAVTKFQGSYVRRALEDGLLYREKVGANPFKLGFIGSSDTHNAAPGSVEEPNYFSKVGRADGTPELRGSIPAGGTKTWDAASLEVGKAGSTAPLATWGASGLAGVWAEENDRESIFAALRRRETFATSGPRIRVRFFGGYDFPADLLTRSDTVRQAYAHGVPMGGDLAAAKGRAPKFLVWAVRDPKAGYLQRAQIVKGWIENGVAKEKVFDVACSDGMKVDPKTARCPDNGASVNLKTCEPDRFKGDVELRTVWTDPGFDPKQRAFYYVRVLENPSCRWSTWDALRNGTPPNPTLAPTIMERAWSSPIWFEPTA